ncbi:hypothetical protein C8J30_10131 [Rhodobacter viridis]|uniref:DUF1684 domain-containing protein n=1 Tax=Rhodobacter viridis TaxID=1054202 RepID=A0A318U9U7_9RHOB|nr:DUF1684 domain-containing protein [Rhodobacter viridis]PYF12651.1 hypothetical protein C8J30_10131 [Rhodobacter viridis]
MTDHADDIARWHAARLVALQAADGWLNLTDRIDLSPGRHLVGQDEACDLRLSVGPARLGVLELAEDGSATLDTGAGPRPFVPVPDAPPRLRTGDLLLEITDLAGNRALRVRDLASPEPARFAGIERFPVDPAWRIVAQWEVLDTPEARAIDTVVGIATEVRLTHRARFTHDGREVTLIPTHWKAGKPMFVIRDATAASETYAAGRFLIGEVEQGGPEGRVVLDFNKAFNPPCAFTDLAACPLPPPENRLPFAIRAGERRPD